MTKGNCGLLIADWGLGNAMRLVPSAIRRCADTRLLQSAISNQQSAIFLVAVFVATSVLAVEADNIRRKQLAQEKARLLATELVSGVLDIQLTQLEENGLVKLPIYGDI